MSLGRHRNFFRRTAWIALLSILFQIAVPVFHHPAAAMPMPEGVHICSLAKTQASDEGQSGKTRTSACPVCKILHHLGTGYVPPHGLMIARLAGTAEILAASPGAKTVHFKPASNAQPRAPPILA